MGRSGGGLWRLFHRLDDDGLEGGRGQYDWQLQYFSSRCRYIPYFFSKQIAQKER